MSKKSVLLIGAFKSRFKCDCKCSWNPAFGWMWEIPFVGYPQFLGHNFEEALNNIKTNKALLSLLESIPEESKEFIKKEKDVDKFKLLLSKAKEIRRLGDKINDRKNNC